MFNVEWNEKFEKDGGRDKPRGRRMVKMPSSQTKRREGEKIG